MKRKIGLLLGVLILALFFYLNRISLKQKILDFYSKKDLPDSIPFRQLNSSLSSNSERNDQFEIPSKINLKVPFTSQAPYGDWDLPYQELCEEAAIMMVAAYYQDRKFTKESANQELLELVKFQKEKYGDYKHTDAEQTAQLIHDFYGFEKIKLIYNPSLEEIKKEIALGHPVIVPTYGRLLGNPYYRSPGPVYHMLVIKGYTSDFFITNDPGTRHGENFKYKPEVVLNAIHEWHKQDILLGKKVAIIISP